jgi:hypothetical protein
VKRQEILSHVHAFEIKPSGALVEHEASPRHRLGPAAEPASRARRADSDGSDVTQEKQAFAGFGRLVPPSEDNPVGTMVSLRESVRGKEGYLR